MRVRTQDSGTENTEVETLQNQLWKAEETNKQLISRLQSTEKTLNEKESKLSLAREKLVSLASLVESEEERKALLEEITSLL